MRIAKLILGYYLWLQTVLTAFAAFGQPENLVIYWAVAAGTGYLAYRLIKSANAQPKPNPNLLHVKNSERDSR